MNIRFIVPLLPSLTVVACGGSSGGTTNTPPNTNGTLIVSTTPGANGAITPTSASLNEGEMAIFTITPNTGFAIDNASGCGGSLEGTTFTTDPVISSCTVTASFSEQTNTTLTQTTYIKASNTDGGDTFGYSAALNEDGTILVVGARREQSSDGTQQDNSRPNGAVYVFEMNTSGWSQQSYIKPASLPQPMLPPSRLLGFGDSVAVNDDGTTIAVAAPGERTVSIQEGAVYLFDLIEGNWVEQTMLKTTNSDGYANRAGFDGPMIAIDGAGDTLVVAEFFDSSITNIINGDESDDDAPGAGAAHVYVRTATGWEQQAFLKGSAVAPADMFGSSIAISGDGNTIAVGTPETSSINPRSGSVYIFARDNEVWVEQQRIQPMVTTNQFGSSVSLNQTGNVLAVGIVGDNTTGNGIGTDQSTCCVAGSGAAYVYTRSGQSWTEEAYFKASTTDISDLFGRTISINSAGDRFVVGAIAEAGNVSGINGDPNNNLAATSGAAYVFSRTNGSWTQEAYLKSANPIEFREFGESVSISGNGAVIAVGESKDASSATGINGDFTNTDLIGAGAVHIYSN